MNRIGTLSGGEAQNSPALSASSRCKMWLLDEPANHLDPAVQGQIYKV